MPDDQADECRCESRPYERGVKYTPSGRERDGRDLVSKQFITVGVHFRVSQYDLPRKCTHSGKARFESTSDWKPNIMGLGSQSIGPVLHALWYRGLAETQLRSPGGGATSLQRTCNLSAVLRRGVEERPRASDCAPARRQSRTGRVSLFSDLLRLLAISAFFAHQRHATCPLTCMTGIAISPWAGKDPTCASIVM